MQTLRATRADAKASILSYEPERQSEQELPRAEEAERRQAEETLGRAGRRALSIASSATQAELPSQTRIHTRRNGRVIARRPPVDLLT